uniref:Uncharacterized protein n=1 Tax=Syphacia muris TaxID=451379 RepID=A0A0N5AI00_9BILA
MVVPAQHHKLIKISHINRRRLIRFACFSSLLACSFNLISASTNEWLFTAEVMKYYVPTGVISTTPSAPNTTDDPWKEEKYFKNATFGPRLFCWLDPETPFHCEKVTYFSSDEPGDVTASVEQSVRKAFLFMVFGTCLDLCGVASIIVCCYREHPYRSLLCSALLHIFAGISTFLCIIVYMSSVSKEVGNKQYPASEIDDPLFHYSYGYSFLLLKASFSGIEIAALLSVLVYMAKRDEITYNRYRIRSVLNTICENVDASLLTTMINSRYYRHSRFRSLERPSWNPSLAGQLFEKLPTSDEIFLSNQTERDPTPYSNLRSIYSVPKKANVSKPNGNLRYTNNLATFQYDDNFLTASSSS